ncbi:MAG: hypothetical protein ACLQMF_13215 [Rectinemataceae bacterium]
MPIVSAKLIANLESHLARDYRPVSDRISYELSVESFLPHRGLRGMRCSGSILFVLCRPVPRKAWERIVATRISCRTPSLPMVQRSG